MTEEKNVSISHFCRDNKIPQKWFIDYLKKNKYIYVQYYGKEKERHKNIAFPKYDTENGDGLFEMNKRPSLFNGHKNNINIQITPKGQEYFTDLLRIEGNYNEKTDEDDAFDNFV